MSIQQIKNVSINLKDPHIDVTEMSLNELIILVGPNGSGKTLVNKFVWFLSSMMHMYSEIPKEIFKLKESAQFVLSHTFDDIHFTGTVSITFDNDSKITVGMNDGEVLNAVIDLTNETDTYPNPIFMSTGMRLFTNINQYLSLRNRINNNQPELAQESLGELLKDYKMYDIFHVEKLIKKCPVDLNQEMLKQYDFAEDNLPTTLNVTPDLKGFVLNYTDGTSKSMNTFGNGHQAIINIVATVSYKYLLKRGRFQ